MNTREMQAAGRQVRDESNLCPYCDRDLSIIKGGPQVNGLHGECAELLAEEMNNAWGPIIQVEE